MATDGRSKHYTADGRLGQQLENGVPNLARQYVDAEPAVRVKKEVMRLQQNQNPLSKAPDAGAKRSGPKAWEELGLSRTEYFRRKKAGRL